MPKSNSSPANRPRGPARRKKGSRKGKQARPVFDEFLNKMESCPNAEALNDEVITPFVQALVSVCDARGYVFNIYGEHCNLAITPEAHAESLYRLIESYLDGAGL